MTVRSSGVALLFLFALFVPADDAWAESCGGRVPTPILSVRTDVKAPTQDLSRGIKELTRDPHVAVPRGLEDFRFAVGATAARPLAQRSWEGHGEPIGDGKWCWRVTKLKIIVSVATTVYIAKEVPRDSCLWREIATHEAKHVRLDQKLFPQIVGIVRPKVLRAIAHSVAAGSEAEANTILGERINGALQEAGASFEKTRNRAQLAIDTRDEYSHPNRVCGNAEVAAAIRRAGLQ